MKKEKAFTLIELLAVIIILAVIALIATPIVLNVVDSARKSAFESSAYGMIDAVKLQNSERIINNQQLEREYTLPSNDIEVQGSQPLGGTIKVDSEGRISIAVYNEKWCVTKGYNEGVITVKDYVEGECELVYPLPIIDKVKTLVYDENNACKTDGSTYQYMGGCYIKAEPSTTLANHY